MSTIPVHTKLFLFELLTNALPDVYQAYARLRRLGGVVRDASGVILLARQDDILKTFADRRFTSVGRQSMARAAPALQQTMEASGLFDLLNFRDDETHRQSRRVLAGLFNAEAMEQIRAAVAAKADVLLARWTSGQAENLVPAVITPLPVRALAMLIGLDEAELMRFLPQTRHFGAWLSAAVLDEAGLARVIDEFASAWPWLEQQLAGRSTLLDEVPPEARRILLGDVLLVLITGYDSRTALLGNALAALAADGAARERLAADPGLSPRAAEELIRYDSPGQVAFRIALEEVAFGAYRIAPGEVVALLNGSGNRDETIHEQADRLDFDRPKRRPLSFGSGPHACVDAALARTQPIGFLDGLRPWLARLDIDASPAAASQHGLLRQHDLIGRCQVPAEPLRLSSHPVFPDSKTHIL